MYGQGGVNFAVQHTVGVGQRAGQSCFQRCALFRHIAIAHDQVILLAGVFGCQLRCQLNQPLLHTAAAAHLGGGGDHAVLAVKGQNRFDLQKSPRQRCGAANAAAALQVLQRIQRKIHHRVIDQPLGQFAQRVKRHTAHRIARHLNRQCTQTDAGAFAVEHFHGQLRVFLGGKTHQVVGAGKALCDHQHDHMGVALAGDRAIHIFNILRAGQAGFEILVFLAGIDRFYRNINVIAVALGPACHHQRHTENGVFFQIFLRQIAAGIGNNGDLIGCFHSILLDQNTKPGSAAH